MQMVGSESGINRANLWNQLPCVNSSGGWRFNGVGSVFLAHTGSLKNNSESFKCHNLSAIVVVHIQYSLTWPQFPHLKMGTFSSIKCHATMYKLSQTGSLNVTTRSVYFSGLPAKQHF